MPVSAGLLEWPPLAMRLDPLAGIEVKLVRASQHLDELDREIGRYLRGRPYRIAHKRQSNGWYLGSFEARKPPPIMPSVIAGEAIGQMRSALDHLISAMIRVDHPTSTKSLNFPICSTPEQFYDPPRPGRRTIADQLRKQLRPEQCDLIKAVQPFETKSASLPTLQRLNNLDKHEIVHAIYAGPTRWTYNRDPNIAEWEWLSEPVERIHDGAALYGVRFVDPSVVHVPMRMELDLVIGPDDLYARCDTLRGYLEEIQDIVNRARETTPELRPLTP